MKKISLSSKNYYYLSLITIILLSFYPLMMGVKLLIDYFRDGYVDYLQYPKYVIPYTPISLTLIILVMLLPLFVKLFKKYALTFSSLLSVGLFLLIEIGFEKVVVFDGNRLTEVDVWQLAMCMTQPTYERLSTTYTIGEDLLERYGPAFKMHFYLIAILIILAVLGLVYGYGKMIRDNDYNKKKPLLVQTLAVSLFIGLCIFACFTAFYRTGELAVAPISAWLMSLFFIVFGFTAGAYSGSLLYFKKPLFSKVIPGIIASLTTLLMYIGELILLGGVVYSFGESFMFAPFPSGPLALVDYLIIVFSGVLTYLVMNVIGIKEEAQ